MVLSGSGEPWMFLFVHTKWDISSHSENIVSGIVAILPFSGKGM